MTNGRSRRRRGSWVKEMMIVGTVQQEDDCSWQDASKSWMEQDVEAEVEVYQVGTCQGGDGMTPGVGRETGHQREAGAEEGSWWAPGPDDLLTDGEEGEYLLELLMRETPAGEPGAASSGVEEEPKSKAAPTKGKGKKKGKKKVPRGSNGATTLSEGEKAEVKKDGKDKASQASEQGKATAPNPLANPEAKGRGLVDGGQTVKELEARSATTSRGECSGQKKPDS
jgi:hypothetical protein